MLTQKHAVYALTRSSSELDPYCACAHAGGATYSKKEYRMLSAQNRARRWNTDKFVTTCKTEWYALRSERAGNDLKIAELARTIHDVILEALPRSHPTASG